MALKIVFFKPFVSFIIGIIVCNTYIWLIGVGASASVPKAMQEVFPIIAIYYGDIIIFIISSIISAVAFGLVFKIVQPKLIQHLIFYLLPICLYLVYISVTTPFSLTSFFLVSSGSIFAITVVTSTILKNKG